MTGNAENLLPAGGSPAMNGPKSYQEMAAELDELAAVPTEVLADWVAARGRCLWGTTSGDPPEWSGKGDADRELTARLCAGCPVRAECLEFELRVGGEEALGVWGALTADDRLALHKVWSARRRTDIAHLSGPEDDTPDGGKPR
jgi:WhiB family transcriptional regulator, redox-sensing transcriptional regulator